MSFFVQKLIKIEIVVQSSFSVIFENIEKTYTSKNTLPYSNSIIKIQNISCINNFMNFQLGDSFCLYLNQYKFKKKKTHKLLENNFDLLL